MGKRSRHSGEKFESLEQSSQRFRFKPNLFSHSHQDSINQIINRFLMSTASCLMLHGSVEIPLVVNARPLPPTICFACTMVMLALNCAPISEWSCPLPVFVLSTMPKDMVHHPIVFSIRRSAYPCQQWVQGGHPHPPVSRLPNPSSQLCHTSPTSSGVSFVKSERS